MIGAFHLIVGLCFVLGMVAIDLDHYNSKCDTANMFKGFMGKDDYQRCGRGILHEKLFLCSLWALTAGVTLHFFMDGLIK